MSTANRSITFTPSLFFQYATCPHWIWHEYYSDPKERGELPELAQKLLEQGVLHEEEYVASLDIQEVGTRHGGEKALAQTIQLMKQGAKYIYQGYLEYEHEGVKYTGRPDLLERRKGKSYLGKYYYAPIDIKNSSDIKKTHWLQLGAYSLLLENIQGVYPEEVAIINAHKERINYLLTEVHRDKVLEQIQIILDIMRGIKPPLKLVSTCKNSPWYKYCIADAEAKNDIALIYKLNANAMAVLRQVGINTVADAATMDIDALPDIPHVKRSIAKRIKLQAQALEQGTIKWLGKPEIPDSELKIYFDIEGDPLLRVEYLFGFWVVGDSEMKYANIGEVRNHPDEDRYYVYFLAKKPEDEKRMWKALHAWVRNLPLHNTLVYHFADYERVRTKQLAERYGSSKAMDGFINRLVDLSQIVQSSVIFPLYFYSIKDIAKSRFVDYTWRHPKAGGAQSIFWYEKWLDTGDTQVLEDIINYNEDDVVATEYLHHWLRDNVNLV